MKNTYNRTMQSTTIAIDSIWFKHTIHSRKRSAQRAVCDSMIEIALMYGTEFLRQGLVFHVLGNKNIPGNIAANERKRYKNLVVVTDKSNEIITTYKNRNPFKYIKMKSKRLCKRKKNYQHNH